MDAVSYSKAAQQATRIGKIINEPDAISGLVTLPSTIAVGETITIPAGRTVVHPNLQVDGTLTVDGTLFIPSGGSVSTTEVDATVVKQNGNVVANDSAVVHKTGNETIAGVKTFSSSPLLPVPTLVNQAISMGNIIEKTGVGIGYATGSGGAVTQVGSMFDPVSLNKPSGKIHTFSQGIPAGGFITFNLYNTQILSIDTIVSTLAGDFSAKYELDAYIHIDGFVVFSIKNKTGGALTESRTINFAIIKGAIS